MHGASLEGFSDTLGHLSDLPRRDHEDRLSASRLAASMLIGA